MKKVLLYLWQLPQNLLGLAVIKATGAEGWLRKIRGTVVNYHFTERYSFGVSLGSYIVMGAASQDYVLDMTLLHEYGHQRQSRCLGWLYLPVIGIPSVCGNLWNRLFHSKWTVIDRREWYYSLPWEAWADRLGGVER